MEHTMSIRNIQSLIYRYLDIPDIGNLADTNTFMRKTITSIILKDKKVQFKSRDGFVCLCSICNCVFPVPFELYPVRCRDKIVLVCGWYKNLLYCMDY